MVDAYGQQELNAARARRVGDVDRQPDGCDGQQSMRLGDPLDPALDAATRALSSRSRRPVSRFASIELRAVDSRLSRFAPAGYLASGALALVVVAVLWML